MFQTPTCYGTSSVFSIYYCITDCKAEILDDDDTFHVFMTDCKAEILDDDDTFHVIMTDCKAEILDNDDTFHENITRIMCFINQIFVFCFF